MAAYEIEKKGKTTIEYLTIMQHYRDLANRLKHNLSEVVAELYSKSLIGECTRDEAFNNFQPEFCRSCNIVSVVLSTIEYDASTYKTFITCIKYLGHDSAAKDLANTFQELSLMDSSTSHHSPADNNSVNKSKSTESGYSEGSAYVDGEASSSSLAVEDDHGNGAAELADKCDNSVHDVSDPCSIEDDWHTPLTFGTTSENSDQEYSNNLTQSVNADVVEESASEQTSEQVVNAKPVYTSVNPGTMTSTVHFYQYQKEMAYHEKVLLQQKAETECWKSQHDLKEHELQQLKQELLKASKEKKLIVKRKDDIIAKLQEDHDNKDQIIDTLKKEKVEIEKRIAELEKKYAEAVKKRETAEIKASAAKKEFDIKEHDLRQQLVELEEKEEKARYERKCIEKELAEVKCARYEELEELKQRNSELEKVEIKLKCELEKHELAKDKEVAVKDKEIAEKNVQLANTEKKLAESRQQVAESKQQVAEQKIEELRRELDSMKLLQSSSK